MKKIKFFLKEYRRITFATINTPGEFFEEIKSEDKSYLKPLTYMLGSNAVYIMGLFLGEFFYYSVFTELIVLYIILAVLFFIYVALMHLAILMVGGKNKFNQTFKVICYSFSPMNFAWIFVLVLIAATSLWNFIGPPVALFPMLGLFASVLYIFYILVTGISVTSEIHRGRAFAALTIQLFIIIFIPIILTYAPALFHQYSTTTLPGYSSTPYPTSSVTSTYEKHSTPTPGKYRIRAYAGSPPQIDGIVDDDDKWHEGERFIAEEKERDYYITIKHDFENIYILMEWEGPFEENGNIVIHFEQDTNIQDFNLSNGRVDSYYQGFYRDGNFSIHDTHYDSGIYTDKERQDGYLKGGYKNGRWTLEWRIPMNSGDKYDIYINNYPTEVGFSITNTLIVPVGNVSVSIFPPGADDYDPLTWANMVIIDNKLRYRIS